ncbi:MAG: NAD(P)-dependent oxidoreductase [Nitrospinaceae bacterium]|nr:MAG: NAD(P)-dependent oxidoreductase [Nitrospinaceae bacterium]
MRILLIGKTGQIGWELDKALAGLGEIVSTGREELDLCQADRIRETIQRVKPNFIINAAAYTAVDKAETEPDLAMTLNGVAPGILAEEARKTGAALIHFSTDYVFDGEKTTGAYLEDDACNPKNVYGQTKLAGEQAIEKTGIPHLILRTSGVYGARGKNFMRTVLKLANEKKELRIVNDQVNSPSWCGAIAQATKRILLPFSQLSSGQFLEKMGAVSGVYHLSCRGETSWYGFARAVLDHSKHSLPASQLKSIPTSEYPTPARRPAYSVLSNAKIARTLQIEMPHWEEALRMCLEAESAH